MRMAFASDQRLSVAMGTVYRRKVKFCKTCNHRLDTRAARLACQAADHAVDIREQPIWWIKYQMAGRPQCVSSRSDKKRVAENLLKTYEADVIRGIPITAAVGRVTFQEASEDLLSDYRMNGRRSLRTAELRVR